MIPKSKLKKLQKDLKGQTMKLVAERLGKSEQAVFATLRGDSYNEETIIALIEYRDEVKAKKEQIISKI